MKPKGLPCSRAIAHPCRDVTRDVELLEEKLEEGEVLGLPGSQQLVSIESLVAQVEKTWTNLGPSNNQFPMPWPNTLPLRTRQKGTNHL